MGNPTLLIIFFALTTIFLIIGTILNRGNMIFTVLGVVCFLYFLIGSVVFHPLVGIISAILITILVLTFWGDGKLFNFPEGVLTLMIYLSGFSWAVVFIYQIVEIFAGHPFF